MPLANDAIPTPNNFSPTEPPSVVTDGVSATKNIPPADRAHIMIIRMEYGIAWMKYGATSFVRKEGKTSARRTRPLGTEGPTRSLAAERMIT